MSGRRGYGAALAALALAGVLTYAIGLYELPDVGELVREAPEELGDRTYAFAGGMALVELGTLLGVPLPFEVGVILSGAVAAEGTIALVPLALIVWACACIGESVNYVTGRRLGRPFLERHGPRLRITPKRLGWLERHFDRRGALTVFFGHVIPFVRSSAPFFAGASLMPYRTFLPWSIAGNAMWSCVFCGLGYAFYRSAARVADLSTRIGVALFFTLSLAAIAVTLWRRRAANRQDAADAARAGGDGGTSRREPV